MKKDIFFIFTLAILFAVIFPFFVPGKGGGDFLAYWSASHLYVTGGNPYDQAQMRVIQAQTDPQRFDETKSLINTWNPPWLILTLLPVGILPYPIAFLVWIFINTVLIGLAVLMTWKMCTDEQQSRGILFAYLAGYLFVETLSSLAIGQITSLVLLGMVLTIWLLKQGSDAWAGVALLFTTIKPQISYFFILLVLFWVIKNHRWKIFIGFIASALISMVVFWITLPNWFTAYISLMRNLPYNQLSTSTLGSFASQQLGISWLKYSAILLIFLINPIMQVIDKEGWVSGMSMAVLISVPLSPYGFNFDQIVILIALVQLISWLSMRQISKKAGIIIVVSLIVLDLIIAFMLSVPNLGNHWYFWIPLAILCIYLIARKLKNAAPKFAY